MSDPVLSSYSSIAGGNNVNVNDVNEMISRIQTNRNDYEVAHGIEDELFEKVLEHIAHGRRNARLLAQAALKSKDIDFPRYCA